jgi:threonine aldolase
LVSIENTHNRCNAVSLTAEYTNSAAELAHKHGLKFHIDGARIFNAAIDQNVPVAHLTKYADSVTFCLSKGLSAPVGSVLCGSSAFIQKALRVRKQLGGGMRQAGILAAAGIVALDTMVDRLAEDHRNAKTLADGLANIPGIAIEPETQHTNMVYFSLTSDIPLSLAEFREKLASHGLLVGGGSDRVRMVTHAWVDLDSVKSALGIIASVLSKL